MKDSLFGDCLELTWGIHELLPDVVCKLEDSDKVANAKTKAHREVKQRYCCTLASRYGEMSLLEKSKE